jgi:thiamine pyrophosphate-dependent acetolactate synthase large subunit-like protein
MNNLKDGVAVSRLVASAFVEQLLASGVEYVFGNPGTTEQAFVDELQDHPGIDYVLHLHEGVAVAAAEGYARATGKVGVIGLHSGPGLGNGMGMLYNASVSHTPLLVYVGQPPLPSLHQEPMLNTDFAMMAAPLAKWAYEVRTPDEVPQVVRRALQVASTPPCGPVVLAIPMDVMESPCTAPVLRPLPTRYELHPDPAAVEQACELLLAAAAPVIITGDGASSPAAIEAVSAIAELLGAPIFAGSLSGVGFKPGEPLRGGRIPLDDGRVTVDQLAPYDTVLAVGTKLFAQLLPHGFLPLADRPVVHVGMEPWELGKNQPSSVVLGAAKPSLDAMRRTLEMGLDDKTRVLWGERRQREVERLRVAREQALAADAARSADEGLTPERFMRALAQELTPDVCVVDESISSYGVAERYLDQPPGNWFRGRGGGIGSGVAMPVGVQLGRPGQPVLCLTGDGSAMYSVTALWTAAHHRLPITWVVLDNGGYRLVKMNTAKYAMAPRPAGREFIGADLTEPRIDFVTLAESMGVVARRVDDVAGVHSALAEALADLTRPRLIHVRLS